MMRIATKNFDILAISLNILYNYFDSLIIFRSVFILAKFLDISAKPFFPCIIHKENIHMVNKKYYDITFI